MRKAKERPAMAAVMKMMRRKYFTFLRLVSNFNPGLLFFLKKRTSKKSMETPIGQT
jgi:hypothetical protein